MEKRALTGMLIVLAILFSRPLYGYICGYEKLYRKGTDTMVDLLFDQPESPPGVSAGELFLMGPQIAFPKFYTTEQILLECIRSWEAKSSAWDLIWETNPQDNWAPMLQSWYLLNMASFFKLSTLKHLRFIPSGLSITALVAFLPSIMEKPGYTLKT